MNREKYVEENGSVVNQNLKDKEYVKKLIIILGIILFIILFYFIARTISRNSECNKITNKIKQASIEYAEKNQILPKSNGDYITFDLDDLINNKFINKTDITVNNLVAKSSIKITKVEKKHIVTLDLKNCDYCSTNSKKWSGELNKEPKANAVDVIAYYNYKKKSMNYTNWTNFIESKYINDKVDKKYNVRLPIQDNMLPIIPKDAKIQQIEVESKEYYRYRDKRWKYYDAPLNYTDYFSSEQPAGFTNYDPNTLTYTEWTEFSLNYPEKKSYRIIENKTAYKWYYMDNGKKVYYNNGQYAVEPVGNKEYIRDNKQSTTMYRYRDKQWRWYNGNRRRYSGYMSNPTKTYIYKDEGLFQYGGYSGWNETSKIDASNVSYREEEISTRYRYRIKYYVLSLSVFEKPVTKEELEQNLNQSIGDILKREDLVIDISYKYRKK